jgi:protein-L-isoaspartate(D-aspartate) O-methyltransferase
MNIEQARFNMVEQQIRTWRVLDQDVLDLLFAVKREQFVPSAYRALAFSDTEIPLGNGATMLPPKFEAHALQALKPKGHEKVLEIGTGSAYMAALLAAHASQVWSVEIDPTLAQTARTNLQLAGIGNVAVSVGDGLAGLASHAPYDVIMVSGGVETVPAELLDQLNVGGRLFAFVGTDPLMAAQLITRVDATAFRTESLFECVVPMLQASPRRNFVF